MECKLRSLYGSGFNINLCLTDFIHEGNRKLQFNPDNINVFLTKASSRMILAMKKTVNISELTPKEDFLEM